MKNLKDSILEKLDINKVNLNNRFPIDGTLDDVIIFLKKHDFKQLYPNGYIDEIVNSMESKCFTYDSILDGFGIWFADTSKKDISEKNPIFFIIYHENKMSIYNVFYVNNGHIKYIVEDNKEKFLKELNKRFEW